MSIVAFLPYFCYLKNVIYILFSYTFLFLLEGTLSKLIYDLFVIIIINRIVLPPFLLPMTFPRFSLLLPEAKDCPGNENKEPTCYR